MTPDFIAGCITGAFSVFAMLVTLGACMSAKKADKEADEIYEQLRKAEP